MNGEDGRTYIVNPNQHSPDDVLPVDPEFADDFVAFLNDGAASAAKKRVTFVGMARDIAGVLPHSLQRLESIGGHFKEWRAVVVENDSTDATKAILQGWAEKNDGRVIADCRNLGRERLSGFEPARVERYAEYRTRYRDISAERFPDSDFIIAVDLDAWGGWSVPGVLNGIGWMEELANAAGLASVSIYEQRAKLDGIDRLWLHYDQWAWRGAGWAHRWERHFPFWFPPVGSRPVQCNSAFGALCIYRAEPFFAHAPESVNGDIEHVGLHMKMAAEGWEFFLNPSQRTLMNWIPG